MKNSLPLHDATFDGIVTSGATITLYFTRPSGRGCAVTLGDVDVLQMEDFRQGNTVMLVDTTTGETPHGNVLWERLYPAPHQSAPKEYHAKHGDFLKSKVASIENGELTLVEMQPAYGADLLAVCRLVNFRDHVDAC